MNAGSPRCLILACGNSLREDDGVGLRLAEWAEIRFRSDADVRVLARQQWTPELADDISDAESVIFIDCATNSTPGMVRLAPVVPSAELPRLMTHHLGAADLLAICSYYYDELPRAAMLLTVGAASLELREGLSDIVSAALPGAESLLEETVLRLLPNTTERNAIQHA
jgi:hydrogenase maturation protease